MRCANCDFENAAGKKFCIRCGVALNQHCFTCGTENSAEASFCGDCGADLSQPTATSRQPNLAAATVVLEEGAQHKTQEGERRHLTVLFCDLVGSTEIASHLDPEEWREIVGEYHRAAAQAIDRFGGHVAQYLGDGVMAYFGWPEAHDNDAERAARAGLAIVDAISKLNERTTNPKLSARIGIDSGAVVVGTGAGGDADVFGDTPNIAARVQAAAAPGTVLVTATTHRLVSGLFVVEDRGAQALKGVERPVQLYQVVQPSGVRGRLEAAAATRGLTPFVGREDELRLLMNRWEHALEGEGQVAMIVGEAGIGKSRMMQRFREQIASTPHTWVEAAAGAFFQNTPFYAVTEMLRELLAWRGDESAEEQFAQLETRLLLAGLKPVEALPLIAPLLNLSLPAKYQPSPLSAEQQRRRLLATLVEWVLGSARVQPTIIATEDLHWADPSTLELLQLLVEQGTTARLLLLYTARSEFRAQWPPRAHHAQITLNRLSACHVRTMVGEVAAQKALSEETIATVVERTGGVPLFVEELTRAVLENGDARLTGREIPVTLHDSLLARLDRLGPAKEVAQVGAVLGGEFSYDLLHAVHPKTEEDLQHALRSLADAELLYVRGIAPEATYLFKHALIRDTAYNTLLKTRRRELHQRIAHALLERFPDTATSIPELLAYHYTEAGLIEQALPYWRKAGRRAIKRSANAEAITHLTKGLELLKLLPETPERINEEIGLQLTLTTPLIATKGYTAPQIETACKRARDLCGRLGQTSQTFSVLGALNSIYSNRAELQTALELAKQMLAIAQGEQNPVFLLWAHYALGFTLADQGQFVSARSHLEQSLALYDPGQRHFQNFVQDPGVTSLAMLAIVLFDLGYPEKALQRGREALALGRKLSHPYSLAFALGWLGLLYGERGEHLVSQQLEEEMIALCSEHGFVLLAALGTIWRGRAMVEQGVGGEGIASIQRGLATFTDERSEEDRLFHVFLLAAAYGKLGQPREGLALLEELLVLVNKTGKRSLESDVYRLKGELLLMRHRANQPEAEQYFRRAISIARHREARSYELRATTSLARLLIGQGKRDEARTTLAEIYNWFTEGFNTADLRDAKSLLDELSTREA